MASPQLENGFVALAYDLYGAIVRAKLSGLEKEVVLAVIYFTYGSGKTRANIDTQDIQIFIMGDRRIRTDRVAAAVIALTQKNVLYTINLTDHQQIMGIQKDFERWNVKTVIDKSGVSERPTRDKLSSLQEYAYRDTSFNYGPTAWNVERRCARLLYSEALSLTGDPKEAALALKDYIDELRDQEWFNQVKMRLTYMRSRFRQWYKSIPPKPRSVAEDELDTGYRHTYNLKTKQWRMSDDKL